jgi:TatD DNase family protein
MFIDTHCHLNFKEFDEDRAMVIGNAKKAGVKKFIIPGTNPITSRSANMLASSDPAILFASVGCHPYDTRNVPSRKEIERLISKRTIAIGECGLDYHLYGDEPAVGRKEEQKQLFEMQLGIALEYHLPVIIHSRDAFDDIFSVLDSLPAMPKGVFHCFSGGLEHVRDIQRRGFFLGLDGNATYSKQLKLVIPFIPLSMILLETDAPYLVPVGHRGERSEPKYIPLIAETIAQLQNINIKEVEETTTASTKQLFHIME